MKKFLPLAAVALQVLVLAWMAGQREWISRTGRVVWLRTAPIDPRDVMRGDYVRLDYEISRVPSRLWRDGLTNGAVRFGQRGPETRVYATLRINPDGLAEIAALSDRKPAEGVFLRGFLDSQTSWHEAAQVRYGLEAFFMEQGKALELEHQRSQTLRGVPLNMRVAVGAGGIGVLKGYRWEALGIALDFDTARRTNQQGVFPQQQDTVLGARVVLKNHGPEPVAIVDLPAARSFGLICDARWLEPAYRWTGESNAPPSPAPRDVIVLQPGQSHTNHLDLTRPEWFVVDIRTNAATRQPRPLQQVVSDWSTGFRIEYRPPSAEACAKLPDAKLIWHGRLRSQWFNPVGRVD